MDLGTPTFEDNCMGSSVSNDAPSVFPVGVTVVTWTVVDASGNEATCEQLVTITDDENPTITCPTAVTQTADLGLCEATSVDLGTPTFDDNCMGSSVSNDAPSVFSVGVTVVTWTVVDASGNETTCEQLVTITDDEAPVAICQDITIILDDYGNASISPTDIDGGSYDACGVTLAIENGDFNCDDEGDNIVTLIVSDASGNVSTCDATVTVEHNVVVNPQFRLFGQTPWLFTNEGTAVEDDKVGLAAHPVDANGYQWTGPNGFTSNNRVVIFDPVTSDMAGEYTVIYTSPNGCMDTSFVVLTIECNPDNFICETDHFEPLATGTIVDTQIPGVTIFGHSTTTSENRAMIFDSDNPTGGDFDLGAGVGQILIISEDGDSSDPDDDVNGGIFEFDFEVDQYISFIDFLDVEHSGGFIKLFDSLGMQIGNFSIPVMGDANQATVDIYTSNVSFMEIYFVGSGAITDYCTNNMTQCMEEIEVEVCNEVHTETWNNGYGFFLDGGSDCLLSQWPLGSGNSAVRLRDNSNSSITRTNNIDLSNSGSVEVSFDYYVLSFENTEDFFFEYSLDGGSTWIEAGHWINGIDFVNNQAKTDELIIEDLFNSITQFRFRCDAGNNQDFLWLDNIVIVECEDDLCNPSELTCNNDHFEPLATGTIVDTQIPDVTIFGHSTRTTDNRAMIFDSDNPTGGDYDLGVGIGQILIISEDGDSNDPDDDVQGGTFDFDFEVDQYLTYVDLLDVEDPGGHIKLYNAQGLLIDFFSIPVMGDGNQARIDVNRSDVSFMEIYFVGSGAVTDYCITDMADCMEETDEDCSLVQEETWDAGYGFFIDGGSDCQLTNWPLEGGNTAVRLRDNSSTSFTRTNDIDLANSGFVEVSFDYYVFSFEGSEDFFFEYSLNGGSTWIEAGNWVHNVDFVNQQVYSEVVNISDVFTSNTCLLYTSPSPRD